MYRWSPEIVLNWCACWWAVFCTVLSTIVSSIPFKHITTCSLLDTLVVSSIIMGQKGCYRNHFYYLQQGHCFKHLFLLSFKISRVNLAYPDFQSTSVMHFVKWKSILSDDGLFLLWIDHDELRYQHLAGRLIINWSENFLTMEHDHICTCTLWKLLQWVWCGGQVFMQWETNQQIVA